MDRGVVLYLSLDHCPPAERSKIHLGMDKTRPEKEGDIRKILNITIALSHAVTGFASGENGVQIVECPEAHRIPRLS